MKAVACVVLVTILACAARPSMTVPEPATPPPAESGAASGDSGAGNDATGSAATGSAHAGSAATPSGGAKLGEPCAVDGSCGQGACVSYFGIAGPRGPEFKSCEIRCGDKTMCPSGLACITIADGPGAVCRPSTSAAPLPQVLHRELLVRVAHAPASVVLGGP